MPNDDSSRILPETPPSPSPREISGGLPLPVTAYPSLTALERIAATITKGKSAKGKGKADASIWKGKSSQLRHDDDDHDHDDDEEAALPAGLSFGIRFTDGEEDLTELWVGEKETVRDVKRRVSSAPIQYYHIIGRALEFQVRLIRRPDPADPSPPPCPLESVRPAASSPPNPARPPPHRRDVPRPVHGPAPLSARETPPSGRSAPWLLGDDL